MLLSFGEMLSALYVDLKYGPTPDATVVTRMKRLLNEAHRGILRTRRLSEERALELEFTSADGQMYYGIPQAFDGIRDVVDLNSAVALKMRTRDWFIANDPQQTSIGTPYVWSPNGMQPVSRQPPINGSGLWAISTSAADTTQQVRVLAVRAGAGFTTEQLATLTGTTPVRVGTLSDIAAVVQFTLSAACAGDVSLLDAPDLPFSLTAPPGPVAQPFPRRGVIDAFNRLNENPLTGGGQWQRTSWQSIEPLAVVGNRAAQPNPAYTWASSYLNSRFSARDAEAYVTVATLPGPSPTFEPYVRIMMTHERPEFAFGPPSTNDVGFLLELKRLLSGTYQIMLGEVFFDPSAGEGLRFGTVPLTVVSVSFAAGDAFGFERAGTLVRVHVRNAGAWHQVIQVSASQAPRPLYPSLLIGDETHLTTLDDFGGGPYLAHILGTIDRFAGTSQPYYSIRLWPTPEGTLTYTVRGTLRIPDMVRDQDYPSFMQPEFVDSLMTYCRMREYKTSKADAERFAMEQAEWEGVIAGLNAASNYPKDYRPVAGRGDRSGWSNLGGWYPADGMSWI